MYTTTIFQTGSDCTFGKESKFLINYLLQYGPFSEHLVMMYYSHDVLRSYWKSSAVSAVIVVLDESSINRSFSNCMEGIDRLRYNPGVVFLSSLYAITTFTSSCQSLALGPNPAGPAHRPITSCFIQLCGTGREGIIGSKIFVQLGFSDSQLA